MYLDNTTKLHETGSPNHKIHGWQLYNWSAQKTMLYDSCLHNSRCEIGPILLVVDPNFLSVSVFGGPHASDGKSRKLWRNHISMGVSQNQQFSQDKQTG